MTREIEPKAPSLQSATVARAAVAGAALALLVGSLGLFWPGVVMFDSVGQFAQAQSGQYEDWHPPVMALLWHALLALFGGGAGSMLALQLSLYWLGFGLVAASVVRGGRVLAAVAVLVIAALPLFAGWQGVVLKDTQMLGATLAAVGLIAWWRVRGARLPIGALAAVVVLLGYATLVRANAVLAIVPLAVLLFGPARWWACGVIALVGIVVALALAQVINHRVIGAAPSGVERTEALYDLAGIAVRDPDGAVGLTPAEARVVLAKHCVKPLFWDPLGTEDRCAPELARLHGFPAGDLYRMLAEAVVRHPLEYAAHRLGHWNSSERWLVAANWPAAAPPAASEPNALRLGSPGKAAAAWQAAARWIAATPLGWPIAWLTLAVAGLCVTLRRPATALCALAQALLVSAIALEASFLLLSIASDLRYHLWPMIATALATVLLCADARWSRRALLATGGALAVVIAAGTVARVMLPAPPISYQALLL
ncbi:hypothetical protein U1872_00405 [Sphingomonas sp. RB3P16]|uniref:hypothetical protein n=1 Tax=Parasphingomonas frigoris TaxID=3096163 RepID=UPI002FCC477F